MLRMLRVCNLCTDVVNVCCVYVVHVCTAVYVRDVCLCDHVMYVSYVCEYFCKYVVFDMRVCMLCMYCVYVRMFV